MASRDIRGNSGDAVLAARFAGDRAHARSVTAYSVLPSEERGGLARGNLIEFATAFFATFACAADFDFSSRISVARCAAFGKGRAGVEGISCSEASATPSLA